jgi:hypothetical protein
MSADSHQSATNVGQLDPQLVPPPSGGAPPRLERADPLGHDRAAEKGGAPRRAPSLAEAGEGSNGRHSRNGTGNFCWPGSGFLA